MAATALNPGALPSCSMCTSPLTPETASRITTLECGHIVHTICLDEYAIAHCPEDGRPIDKTRITSPDNLFSALVSNLLGLLKEDGRPPAVDSTGKPNLASILEEVLAIGEAPVRNVNVRVSQTPSADSTDPVEQTAAKIQSIPQPQLFSLFNEPRGASLRKQIVHLRGKDLLATAKVIRNPSADSADPAEQTAAKIQSIPQPQLFSLFNEPRGASLRKQLGLTRLAIAKKEATERRYSSEADAAIAFVLEQLKSTTLF